MHATSNKFNKYPGVKMSVISMNTLKSIIYTNFTCGCVKYEKSIHKPVAMLNM